MIPSMDENSDILRSVAVRPLAKGMYDDRISQMLEPAAGVDVQGFDVTPYGLATSGGLSPYEGAIDFLLQDAVDPEFVLDTDVFTNAEGTSRVFAISNKFIYATNDLKTWTPVYFHNEFASWVLGGVANKTFTCGIANIVGGYLAGMLLRMPVVGGSYSYHEVESVTATTIVVKTVPQSPDTSRAIQVYARLNLVKPLTVQYARTPGGVLITDGTTKGIFNFTGTNVEMYAPQRVDPDEPVLENGDTNFIPATFVGARTIAYMGGRVLIGAPNEPGGRLRVRWSSPIDGMTFDALDYADFPASRGSVIRITRLEDYAVIFTEDGVIVGQPYGYDASYVAPWLWRPVSSGGAGPVGPYAFCEIPGGMVFLGLDDLYSFSPLKRTDKGDFVIEAMKCPVRRRFSLTKLSERWRHRLFFDPSQSRVIISMPTDDARTFKDQFFWSVSTGEWSHRGAQQFEFTCFNYLIARLGSTSWAEAATSGTTWSDAPSIAWITQLEGDGASIFYIYLNPAGQLHRVVREAGQDGLGPTATPIERIFETGDFDLNLPDGQKTLRKISLRLRREAGCRDEPIEFTCEGSTDKGRNWKLFPSVRIAETSDEGEIHCAIKGNTIRLRFTTTSTTAPYTLEELTLKARLSGNQVIRNG